MRIQRIVVKHFRSIKKLDLEVSPATIFAGPNSCGKSNVLRAIRFAFVESYTAAKAASNFPVFVMGPAAEISVTLTFEAPSAAIAAVFGLPLGQSFVYEVAVSRNGNAKFKVNGQKISASDRAVLLSEYQIVYVPPIRDISSGGLDPLKGLLSKALRNAKKGLSISSLNQTISNALVTKGAEVLSKADKKFGSISSIGQVAINANSIDSGFALDQLGLEVDLVSTGVVPLEALGTGHQSQVVMNLFGSLGAAFQGQVLYMFEEPDNHLHPTALLSVAEQMRSVVSAGAAQIFVSSHSPSFIGSFPIANVLVLDSTNGVTGQKKRLSTSNRRMHALLARYGLKPIEALLARAVLLVEGPSDVSLIRGVCSAWHSGSPDQRDVLVVPCGGKTQIVEIYSELLKLGVVPFVVFDGDASLGGSPANLRSTADAAILGPALDALLLAMNPASKKVVKSLNSIKGELANGPPVPQAFAGSPVEAVVKASGKVNAVDQSKISSALAAGKRTVWQPLLGNANIWVWKLDPESVLAAFPGCIATINNALVTLQSGAQAIAPASTTDVVKGWLHNNASEPEVHETVVCALLKPSQKRGEMWEFSKFLATALS